MASLIGETVQLTVTFSTFANSFFSQDVFTTSFTVGGGVEVSGQSISATFTAGGFSQTMSGTISVNVDDDDFSISFSGTQQAGSLSFRLESLADQSAAAVTSATQTGSSGTGGGINQTLAPTFGGADGGFATGGFQFLGFQPGVSVGQSVGLGFLDASAPPVIALNTGATVAEGALEVINGSELDTNDSDTGNSSLVYTVSDAVDNGTLFRDANGNGVVDGSEARGLGGTFTQADVNANLIKYLHDGGETTSDAFDFSVSDGVTPVAGTFNLTVTPVNDAPTIANLDGDARTWSEAFGVNVGIDQGLDSLVADADDADFNGGSLTVSFDAQGLAWDRLVVANGGFIATSGSNVFFNGDLVGQFSGGNAGGDLVVNFTAAQATADAVGAVLKAIQYANDGGDNPTARELEILVTVNDGAADSASATVTVNVVAEDDPGVAEDDALATDEATAIDGASVFVDNGSGGDFDPDSSVTVGAVNGSGANVGTQITLPSGALLTVTAAGEVFYDPNGAFSTLPGQASGAVNLSATDSFSYALADGDSATVTITIMGLDGDGDILLGDGTDNTLNGGIGADSMEGLGGNDTYLVDNAGDVVIEASGTGTADRVKASVSYTLASGVHVEQLTTVLGSATDAINLTGNSLTQEIVGNYGANTLTDGPQGGAADHLRGLSGDDVYRIFNSGSTIVESAAQGAADRVMAAVDYTLAEGVHVELLTTILGSATDAINLTGNALTQEIVGNYGANTLTDGPQGGAADHLRGLSGNDVYRVFNLATTIVESSAQGDADRVIAAVDYELGTGVHVELLTTNAGGSTSPINLTGNELAQEIVGNAGANVLHDGGVGTGDHLRGLSGNDTYRVFNADTTIVESAAQGAADKVIAAVNYTLGAGVHIETLQTNAGAGTGNLRLTGNELEQTIIGNNGDNRLEGKGGDDTLRGLGGNDTFVFADALGPDNVDTILDFDPADDRFLLSNNVFSGFGERTGAILPGHLRVNTTGEAQDASDMIIYDSDDGFLYYDADGFGSGARIHFATIDPGLAITNSDFVLA